MKKKIDGQAISKPRVSGDAELKLMIATWRKLAGLPLSQRARIMDYLQARSDEPPPTTEVVFPLEQ